MISGKGEIFVDFWQKNRVIYVKIGHEMLVGLGYVIQSRCDREVGYVQYMYCCVCRYVVGGRMS